MPINYLKIIRTKKWKEEESPIAIYLLDHWKTGHLQSVNAYTRPLFSYSIYYFSKNYGYEWIPYNDSKNTFIWILEKYQRDPDYVLEKIKEFEEVSKEIKNAFDKIYKIRLADLSDQALSNRLGEILNLGKKQYGYGLVSEGLDVLEENDYLKFLPNVSREAMPEIIEILSSSGELSVFLQEKLDLLKIAKDYLKSRDDRWKLF